MNRIILLSLSLIFSSELIAQNNFKIFDTTKTFVYDAYFIENNVDTLTRELIKLKANNKPWVYQKKQKELEISYYPDSLNLEKFMHPFAAERKRIAKGKSNRAQGKKRWENYTWITKSETTGFIENDSLIWLHPPRSNQYQYTYLSAYPEVLLKELRIGGNWKSQLFIARGFPNNKEFVGNVINDFKVNGLVSDSVGEKSITNCWEIESVDTHSILGESRSTFIFDEKYYGFIRMEFEYYNKIKIVFKLKEIIIT
ncbi:hypothetical protein MMU07_08030 [Aquiflexum sp. LQ15W]|uniref:hypothetical protein n=1 Tax=Cognataquiflexum nitidum TaxID=2922272 RepID=UPI001F12E3D4|nr:hypothetical protein [Cognataquiflexum nitidum]MCH6199522.1 hypothetical protein [Cognataquiflexum nitidum]